MKGLRAFLLGLVLWAFGAAACGVETLVIVEEPSAAKAVDMIRTGALDLYGAGVTDPELLRKIRAELACSPAYTAVWFLSLNPAGPLLRDGKLNPFALPAVREALNWLIHREHLVQEVMAGAGLPQYLPLRPVFLDYARLAEHARPLELRYAWDPPRAKEALARALQELGCELREGQWHFQGNPVEVRVLIRTDARRPVGDYVARVLEEAGFRVTRTYAGYAEAMRLLSANPEEGLWHVYTNGLVVSVIERDEAGTFALNYTPVFPHAPWRDLRPSPRLAELAQKLAQRAYATLEERTALMVEALAEAMRDSSQIWLAVRLACYPRSRDLELAVDLAAGLSTGVWARTLRSLSGKDTVRLALPTLLAAPLNPVAGSFTAYDQTVIRATVDPAFLPDPYNGLYIPVDVERAEVVVREGRPVQASSAWLALRPAPEIPVPPEAWLAWDPEKERFWTVGELFPQGLAAQARVTLRYRPDLWEKTWHDGSRLSPGDFLLRFVLLWDRAHPSSPLYDESAVPGAEALRQHFRGLLVRSWDPLVVEVYTDFLALDAEWIAAEAAKLFHPAHEYGPGPWHVLALLIRAEAQGRLSMSSAKAQARKTEWASLLSGPSLAVLQETLVRCAEEAFLPYPGLLGRFVPQEEVRARYAALARWAAAKGHFWVGNGPYFVDLVKPVEKILVLRRGKELHPDPGRWAGYAQPRIPWARVSGPVRLVPGSAVAFLVEVGYGEEPAPPEDVLFVKYLLFGPQGELLRAGQVPPGPHGFLLTLTPAETAGLPTGAVRLEVVAAFRSVALCAWDARDLVVVGPGG
ncbi:MAG: ABC transporter substrate-binding protein [Candidatus Bipolaricaulaceae bacterium]